MEEAKERDQILVSLPASENGGSFVNANSSYVSGLENFNQHKYRLRSDGYIDYIKDGSIVKAWRTPKGTDYLRQGGYQKSEKNKLERIKSQKKDRVWSRINIIVAVLSLLVSILAFLNSNIEN